MTLLLFTTASASGEKSNGYLKTKSGNETDHSRRCSAFALSSFSRANVGSSPLEFICAVFETKAHSYMHGPDYAYLQKAAGEGTKDCILSLQPIDC